MSVSDFNCKNAVWQAVSSYGKENVKSLPVWPIVNWKIQLNSKWFPYMSPSKYRCVNPVTFWSECIVLASPIFGWPFLKQRMKGSQHIKRCNTFPIPSRPFVLVLLKIMISTEFDLAEYKIFKWEEMWTIMAIIGLGNELCGLGQYSQDYWDWFVEDVVNDQINLLNNVSRVLKHTTTRYFFKFRSVSRRRYLACQK